MQTYRDIYRYLSRQAGRQTGYIISKETENAIVSKRGSQTERQTDRQTEGRDQIYLTVSQQGVCI